MTSGFLELTHPEMLRLGATAGVQVVTSVAAVLAAATRRTRAAVDEILFTVSGNVAEPGFDRALLPLLRSSRAPVRGVWAPDSLARTAARASTGDLTELAAAGRVRWSPDVVGRCIVWDREAAVMPLDPVDMSRGALLVRSPMIVTALRTMIDAHWRDGTPWDGVVADLDPERLDRRDEVLAMLAEGLTDDLIARRLEITERTVQRIVADLRRTFRVETRFQLGVVAAQNGLVRVRPTG